LTLAKVAVIVTTVLAVTLLWPTVNVTDVLPAGIVTVDGGAAEVLELASVTTAPPVGAGPEIVTVPVTIVLELPCTVVGETATERRLGGVTVRLPCAELAPSVAVTVAVVAVATGCACETTKVAEDFPLATVTDAGTVMRAVFELASLTLNPTSVGGGSTATGTITLTGAAPNAGLTVSLASNSTNASVPASVKVLAGAISATFTVTTKGVSAITSATITAKIGTSSKTATLTVTPASLASVSISPATAVGGSTATVTGTVTDPGTDAAVPLAERFTTAPPAGAGRANVTVPVVELPPTMVGKAMLMLWSRGVSTDSVPDAVVAP